MSLGARLLIKAYGDITKARNRDADELGEDPDDRPDYSDGSSEP